MQLDQGMHGLASLQCRLSVMLLLPVALISLPSTAAAGVELSSSALMFYNGDVQPEKPGGMSQCELLVRRAAAHGGRRVQLVPTHYWIDPKDGTQDPKRCYPDNWADPDLSVKYYCTKQAWNTGCDAFSPDTAAYFRDGLQQCFSVAAQLFDEVLIAPHLDPLGETSKRPKWRNLLRFDPLAKDEKGYSYWDIMLKPILDAANNAFKQPGKTFHFAMGGEMGGTIITYPGQYLKIIQDIRKAWTSQSQLRTGVTFFSAYAPGQIIRGPGPIKPLDSTQVGYLEGGYGPLLPFAQWPGVSRIKAVQPDLKRLMAAVDFLGVSNYARAPSDVAPHHLESSTANLLAELTAMGVDVQPFVTRGSSKQMIWNEFGLGGGISSCNSVMGKDGQDLGLFPWLGLSGEYDIKIDPFKQSPAAQAYLQKYYNAALQLLAAGGGKYKVDAAYIWNVASWDVQGIHTASAKWNTTVQQGDWPVRNGYADANVIKAIKAHNAKIK